MIPKDFSECVAHFNKLLNVDHNFDIVYRQIKIAGRDAALYFVDGFCKTAELRAMIEILMEICDEKLVKNASNFSQKYITGAQSKVSNDEIEISTAVLSGETVLFVEGFSEAIFSRITRWICCVYYFKHSFSSSPHSGSSTCL